MPLFTYFALVGSVLVGLLYVAEARLGPPKSLSISTSFHGLPAPFKGQRSAAILTARDAPVPDMTGMNPQSAAVTQPSMKPQAVSQQVMSQPIMAQAADTPPPKTAQVRKSKKPAKTARKKASGNMYAQTQQRQYGGVVW
jgi:hypothetical protein